MSGEFKQSPPCFRYLGEQRPTALHPCCSCQQTDDVAHVGQRLGGSLAGAFGALLHDAAEIFLVAADVEYALADRERHLEDILGELFLEVAVADGAVGVGIADVLYDVGSGGELEQ